MTRNVGVGLSVVFVGAAATLFGQQPPKPTVEVHKSATCGCCSKWIEHLQANGFTADAMPSIQRRGWTGGSVQPIPTLPACDSVQGATAFLAFVASAAMWNL